MHVYPILLANVSEFKLQSRDAIAKCAETFEKYNMYAVRLYAEALIRQLELPNWRIYEEEYPACDSSHAELLENITHELARSYSSARGAERKVGPEFLRDSRG